MDVLVQLSSKFYNEDFNTFVSNISEKEKVELSDYAKSVLSEIHTNINSETKI